MGSGRALRRSRDSTLAIGPLLAAPEVLERLGADVAAVLAEARMTREQFESPDNVISYDAMGRLFARGVAHTGCQHLGLLVGQPGGLHSLGLVGLLVRCSRDVGTALRSLERHFHLRVRGAALVLDVDGPTTRMGHVVHDRVEATEQINDGALAEVFNILRVLCGPKWRPTEIQFARTEASRPSPVPAFLRRTVALRCGHARRGIQLAMAEPRAPGRRPGAATLAVPGDCATRANAWRQFPGTRSGPCCGLRCRQGPSRLKA